MDRAARAALILRATTRGARGAARHVHVVLLRDPGSPEPFGLHVGRTSRDVDVPWVEGGHRTSRSPDVRRRTEPEGAGFPRRGGRSPADGR